MISYFEDKVYFTAEQIACKGFGFQLRGYCTNVNVIYIHRKFRNGLLQSFNWKFKTLPVWD